MPVQVYGYDGYYDTWYILNLLVNGWQTYRTALLGERYYYQLGHNGALMMMRLFIVGDKIASS